MRDELLFPLFKPLDSLPGIGPKLKPVLERLVGGDTVWDLLLHLPERWMDRQQRASIGELEPGSVATVRGEVHGYKPPYSERAPHRIQLFDGSGFLTLAYFHADGRWLKSQFPIGKERIVSGPVAEFNGERQMTHPDYVLDPASGEKVPPVEPIYALTAGLTNKRLHGAMAAALDAVPGDLEEWIAPDLVSSKSWPAFKTALKSLHQPTRYDEDAFSIALDRLSYDEALAREISFALSRLARDARKATPIPLSREALNRIAARLPYKLTAGQIAAAKDIADDLASPRPMRRMLQGDVGAGKTVVAMLAAAQTADAGFQSAFMAPTEVLARQQYAALDDLLSPAGYQVAILTGRDSAKQREATLMGLADGSIQIVAGTQALFQERVRFPKLGFVIVDEQHRFGVADRMKLAGKSASPHMLVMSATPIPRTLALAVNGDLDISVISEKPAGRKPVETRAIPSHRIDDVIASIDRATQRGEQAFWVCPTVDAETDGAAVHRAEALSTQLGRKVGLVHGRLSSEAKDKALSEFRSGETTILVATTVIEVGIDVPNATIMVIERADGFGLSQLHQLRGRVGRSDKASYCILLYDPPLGETARERLDVLRRTDDGFEIAEADFRLRGPGDLLGLRQSGAIETRILNPATQADLIETARTDARYLVGRDPDLTGPRGKAVRLLRQLFAPPVIRRE